MRRLCLFYKVASTKLPGYIYDFIPPVRKSQWHLNTFNSFSCRTEYFINFFFPCIICDWNKLNPEIRSSGSYNVYPKSLSNFIWSNVSNVYNVSGTIDIKLITRLRLGFSHSREQKFKYNFQDTLNPPCSCRIYLSLLSMLPYLWYFAGYTYERFKEYWQWPFYT